MRDNDLDRKRIAKELIDELLANTIPDYPRPGLKETPDRFAEAWNFWMSGYEVSPATVLKVFEDGGENYDEMVFQSNIPFFSLCEHHLAPIVGTATIAYIPKRVIVGLSKLPRLLEIYARRLQIQERICNQVADALYHCVEPAGVGVVLKARHLCMESRGIQKIGAITITTALRGNFKSEPEVRAKFMALVNGAHGEHR